MLRLIGSIIDAPFDHRHGWRTRRDDGRTETAFHFSTGSIGPEGPNAPL
jgi:hypothetical protein